VEEGYAQAATYPPDVKHAEEFVNLQREASDARRGLWGL
jgi:micrococcal nuclease